MSSHATLISRYKKFRNRHVFYSKRLDSSLALSRIYWSEIQRDRGFLRELLSIQRSLWPGHLGAELGSRLRGGPLERTVSPGCFAVENAELYVIVRMLRPMVAIETGVAAGVSSAIILQAMCRNGFGQLYSIDFPMTSPGGYVNADGTHDGVYTPPELGSGWIVPERLRDRWSLHLGRTRDLLPSLFETLGGVNLFYHDSDHSKANMLFEAGQAWPRLATGGCLYMDDIFWNDAFREFVTGLGINEDYAISPVGRGLLVKSA